MSMWELPVEPVVQEQWICKSALFSQLCLAFGKLSGGLYDRDEDPEDNQEAKGVRIELARLRYLPYQGNPDFLQQTFPDKGRLERQFGGEIVMLLDSAETLLQQWQSNSSILIQTFKEQLLIEVERVGLEQIRIVCRSSDKQLFQNLLTGQVVLEDHHFISGIESYRESASFEVLFRVGSFRREGMQKIAPAILTAPKYKKLVRFCWDRTMDEEGVASDPVVAELDYLELMPVTKHQLDDGSVATSLIDTNELDQLMARGFFDEQQSDSAPVSCLRLVLPGHQAVLFRRGHSQLIYQNVEGHDEVLSIKARDIKPGDYWVETDVEVDLGKEEINPEDYPMAQIWKAALSDLYRRNPSLCVTLMSNAGIRLKDLHKAAKNWGRFYKYTVNAPQKKLYFKALLEQVLSQNIWEGFSLAAPQYSVSENAWNELSSYKSQMIEDGQLGHQIVSEQLQSELSKALRAYFSVLSRLESSFPFTLPDDSGLSGKVVFRKVQRVDRGFRATEENLSKLMDVEVSEQFATNQED